MLIQTIVSPLRENEDGVIYVGKTRVPIDTVVYAYRRGKTPEQIVNSYPTLALADVYATLAFYLQNHQEVDAYITRQEAESDAMRKEIEKRFPQEGLREKLLERLKNKENSQGND
ncbi:MAG: DUF433 domain-containing protein [Anaerolineae bacterium]|nr:DUF433 domain-containing protein [Anaerolineae bacterium]